MSQFKTFLVPFSPTGESEEELNAFLRGHRIVDVQKLCVPERGWCFCVEWLEGGGASPAKPIRFEGKVDYMKVLPPKIFDRFAKLRDRRKELALAAGTPPYNVATDAQLAKMAQMDEPTTDKIALIDGFGESRMKMYSKPLLETLNAAIASERDAPEAPGESKQEK